MASKQPLKDPKGGLTAAGRRHFKRKEGANLKAGVKGKADTPQKMRRKGSFLTRFFTNPSGPMVKPNGEPSRLALSANAWGEPVPKNRSDAARLAAKGRRLLERYENTKVEKYNPYHDELGRFTSGGSASKVTSPKLTSENAPSVLKALALAGGFTFNPKRNETRKSGVAVAIKKDYESATSVESFSKNGEKLISQYMRKYSEILSKPNNHLGAWVDKGKVYLDISTVVPTLKEAADIGRKNDQIGIFQLSTFTTWSRVKNPTGGDYRYFPQSGGVSPYNSNLGFVNTGEGATRYELGKSDSPVIFVSVDNLLDDSSIKVLFDKIMSMTTVSKSEPTVSDVHLPTIMNNKKKRKRTKKMMLSDVVAKTEELNKANPYHDELGRFTTGGSGGRGKMQRSERSRPVRDPKTGAIKYPDEMRRNSGTGSFGASMADIGGYKQRKPSDGSPRNRRGSGGVRGRKKSRATKPRPKISRRSSTHSQLDEYHDRLVRGAHAKPRSSASAAKFLRSAYPKETKNWKPLD